MASLELHGEEKSHLRPFSPQILAAFKFTQMRCYSARQNNMQICKSVHLCTGKTSGFLKKELQITIQKLAHTIDSLHVSNRRCFHCYH